MIYNLENPNEQVVAKQRLDFLCEKGKKIEIKEIRFKRTLDQNAYLHLILTWFAIEYGETKEYVKDEIFKKIVNKDLFKSIYRNPKNGKERVDWRSTASLDTKEMTDAIDRFRNWSSKEAGIYLPEADNVSFLNMIQEEERKYKQYL